MAKDFIRVVKITCDTPEQADTVLAERTNHDEDYGFEYTIEEAHAENVMQPWLAKVDAAAEGDSNDAEIGALSDALSEACSLLGVTWSN